MVVFTCNHCGESLKKNVVDKHKFRCRKEVSVSCMDCFKDFYGEQYSVHTTCITEAERYSGKDYVAKPGQNKGQRKQEAWVDMIRSIGEKHKNLSQGVKNVLETISSYDNIPRKKAKFLNFMKNSFKYFKVNELEEAWGLLEIALKESKAEQQPQQNGTNKNGVTENGKRKLEENRSDQPEENGTEAKKKNGTNKNGVTENGKRKLEENGSSQPEENGTKAKKKKIEEEITEVVEDKPEKFNWTEAIRSIILSKNNEIKLSKLRKKVLNRYKKFTGSELSDKLESKFNKKLKKSQVVVDNEKVRLIE